MFTTRGQHCQVVKIQPCFTFLFLFPLSFYSSLHLFVCFRIWWSSWRSRTGPLGSWRSSWRCFPRGSERWEVWELKLDTLQMTHVWCSRCVADSCMNSFSSAGQTEGQTSPGQMVEEPIHPVNIPRREKDFQGMLEYKREDEMKLVKNLILGKK